MQIIHMFLLFINEEFQQKININLLWTYGAHTALLVMNLDMRLQYAFIWARDGLPSR